jgi:hypothetical protein
MAAASAVGTTKLASIPGAFSKARNRPICRSSSQPIRTGHQPQNRQSARPHHPGNAVGHRRRGDSVGFPCCLWRRGASDRLAQQPEEKPSEDQNSAVNRKSKDKQRRPPRGASRCIDWPRRPGAGRPASNRPAHRYPPSPARRAPSFFSRETLISVLRRSFQRRNSSTWLSRAFSAETSPFEGRSARSGMADGGRGVVASSLGPYASRWAA